MAGDYATAVRRSFENIGPRNPLRKLTAHDRRLLVAFLQIQVSAPESGGVSDFLEEIAQIADEAGALGSSIKAKMFAGPLAESLAPFLGDFQYLPAVLALFSKRIGDLVENAVGKRGHKGRVYKNQFLIMASEFVRQKTGKHYDEHLAELLQSVPGVDADGDDISGDAIRKKREHLKRTYPLIYRSAVDRARRIAGGQPQNTP